jgi:hypothetical protein
MLAGIVVDHLGGWLAPQAADPQTAARAQAFGAPS